MKKAWTRLDEAIRHRWRRWARTAAKLGLLGLALWLTARLLAGLQWEDLAARVEDAALPWLLAAVAALVLRFVVWDERWRRAMDRVGPVPPRHLSFASLVAAATVNTITPTARVLGGLMRARHLSRAVDEPMGRAYGSVLYDQVAHQVMNSLLSWLALIAAAALTGRPGLALLLAAALAVAAALFALWLHRRRRSQGNGGDGNGGNGGNALVRWLAERVTRGDDGGDGDGEDDGEPGHLRRLMAHGRDAVGVVRRLLTDRRLTLEAVILGAAFFVVNAAAQWFVFRALDSPVPFVVVLAVVSLGAAAGVAVGTPGGVGGAEAAMIAAFTAFGVGPLDAAAGSLLFRALHFGSILGLGGPSLLWLEARLGRPDLLPGSSGPADGSPAGNAAEMQQE